MLPPFIGRILQPILLTESLTDMLYLDPIGPTEGPTLYGLYLLLNLAYM